MAKSAPSPQERLAAALRGDHAAWPDDETDANEFVEAILCHGVAGLILERAACLEGWPRPIVDKLRSQARAQAMWELRHRALLGDLTAALAEQSVDAAFMKGTAIAYDLYANPSARARGDSDLLIDPRNLDRARSVLDRLGFVRHAAADDLDADLANQESWALGHGDGTDHVIDLHWRVMNAPALKHVLTVEECMANMRPLPGLSPEAHAMDRVRLMIHTCLHRAMHRTAPYFVGGRAHFGSDRLIWTHDIHLLAGALTGQEWAELCSLARDTGASRTCLEGLESARRHLNADIPPDVMRELQDSAHDEKSLTYLRQTRALPRAWQDLRAVSGHWAKLRYARARLLPRSEFMRAKYPGMRRAPLPLLYVRRVIDLMRRRSRERNA